MATLLQEKRLSLLAHESAGDGLTFALQALLARHESYVNDSQREHQRLNHFASELENEKLLLQSANERMIAENRDLLLKLEALNANLRAREDHVNNLETQLKDRETEATRLNSLARRASELELQAQEAESQKTRLEEKLAYEKNENASILTRWCESARKIQHLEIEVTRLEWESRKEREKHQLAISKVEQEQTRERELGASEGRLKGAAAVGSIKNGQSSNGVVSQFVRDILQDNANLQAGIAELRELLQTSNDEVQSMREQVLNHQPISDQHLGEEPFSQSLPLVQETGWEGPGAPKQAQQQVHVHHHYHAKVAAKRTPSVRRSSKRRAYLGPSNFSSTPDSSIPGTPSFTPTAYPSSPMTAMSIYPPNAAKRWSSQSTATGVLTLSSMPSSPRSYLDRTGSIFDRIEQVDEVSRPTSPESCADDHFISLSPTSLTCVVHDPKHDVCAGTFGKPIANKTSAQKHISETPTSGLEKILFGDFDTSDSPARHTYEETVKADHPPPMSTSLTARPSLMLSKTPVQAGKDPPVSENTSLPPQTSPDGRYEACEQPEILTSGNTDLPDIRPSRHRRGSHDSLLSISGMDIHIPRRTGPSPFTLLRGNSAYFAKPPSAQRSISASQPVAMVTEYNAISGKSSSNAERLLSSHASPLPPGPQRSSSASAKALSGLADSASVSNKASGQIQGGFGRLMGEWVKGKWGIAPTRSLSELGGNTASGAATQQSSVLSGRVPGINQTGAIPGLRSAKAAPSDIQPKRIDEEGLRDGLVG